MKVIDNEKLMQDWDWEKNNQCGYDPNKLTCGSKQKVWWKIKYTDPKTNKTIDLSWQASIAHKKEGRGCPYISQPIKKILVGFNDLSTTHPDLAKEWATKENNEIGLKITDVTYGSTKVAFWCCNVHGVYQAKIADRNRGNGCPYCSGKKVLVGFNDLKTTHPEIAKEWDYDKNDISPEMISRGCEKPYWWKCEKGHSWKVSPNSRTNGNTLCPYCANKKVLSGYNDLKTLYPSIASEWDYDRNILGPENYLSKSNKKVWWICKYGHEYSATIANRVIYNAGCSICNKERQTSFPEKAIFYYISNMFSDAQENVTFKWLGRGELDIYVPSLKLGVEYDGYYWHQNIDKDYRKDQACITNNVRLIRIRNEECIRYESDVMKLYFGPNSDYKNLDAVIIALISFLKETYNLNIIIDVNIDRDYTIIMESFITREKENSLAKKRPDLLIEWDYNKNGKIKPEFVSLYSNKSFWWLCPKCGQSYKMKLNDRTGSKHSNCPICASKKIIKGVNDLSTTNPELMKEWDFEKNTVSPYSITGGNHKKVWWKCEKGHSWQTSIYVRAKMGSGCPICAHQIVGDNNSFADLYPDLLEEWDYEKNERDPYTLLPQSNLKFWWKCKKCGYSWQTDLAHRTHRKRGCPLCAHQVLVRGINDLETQFPEIAKEWNYDKNDKKPYEISGGTNKKYWWKCNKCGYEWECVVASRTKRGSKCPQCRSNKEK